MNTIIVAPSELAVIWNCNVRTIKNLEIAGIVVKIGPAKIDLLKSTANYISHLRRVATGLTTSDQKAASLQALTDLRNAQRILVEKKSGGYIKIPDANDAFVIAASKAREKILLLPLRIRRAIEDTNPVLFASMRDAFAVEDAIDTVVCMTLSDIAAIELGLEQAEHEEEPTS